jgi:putative hydrolase of the HAD superfamily
VPIQAVIFDIGGVLELTPSTGWPRHWASRLGADPTELERRLDRIWRPGAVGAVSLETIERETAAALGLDHVALRELMDDAWRDYLGTLNGALAECFAGLRPRYKTGILSNSFVGAREREQAMYGFGDMCDDIVYSHEVGRLKPEPEIYALACERLDVRPEDAILLDDVQVNVDGARQVGMRAIRFIDNDQAMTDLQAEFRI